MGVCLGFVLHQTKKIALFLFLPKKMKWKKFVRLKILTLTHTRCKTKSSCSSFQQFSLRNAPQHLVRIHHDKPDIQAASFPKLTLQTDLHNHLKILKELPSPGRQPLATLSPLTFPLSVSPFDAPCTPAGERAGRAGHDTPLEGSSIRLLCRCL